MRKILRVFLPRGEDAKYMKHISTLASAHVATQVLPFIFIPILTRIYTSEDPEGVFKRENKPCKVEDYSIRPDVSQ